MARASYLVSARAMAPVTAAWPDIAPPLTFGTKVSLATTLDGGFVVGARSFPGNPYDGHTLAPALEQVTILTDQVPDLAVVDRGYRGHGVEATMDLHRFCSGQVLMLGGPLFEGHW